MRLISLRIAGFRSFRDEQKLKFGKATGLCLLSGENRLEPDMGANAAGKSTVWDALSWVIYGKSARGVAGPNLANWAGAACAVTLRFEADGRKFELTRTRDPNELFLMDGEIKKILTQPEVDKIFGMDFETFTMSRLMGQFGTFFFDLSPTEKLSVFSTVMRLDLWEKAGTHASKKAKEHDATLRDLEQKQARCTGQMQSATAALSEATNAAQDWSAENEKKIKRAVVDADDASAKLSTAEKDLKNARALLDQRKEAVEVTERTMGEGHDAEKEASAKVARMQERYRAQKGQTDALQREYDEMQRLVGKDCPACRRPVGANEIGVVLGGIGVKLNASREEEGKIIEKGKAAKLELKAATDALSALNEERRRAQGYVDRAQESTNLLVREVSTLTAAFQAAKHQLLELKKATNPHEASVRARSAELKELDALWKELTSKAAATRRLCNAAEYWRDGFKTLRLWLVDRALKELEVTVNSSLVELGLNDWKIRFDIERPKQDGSGTTKGFTVMIYSPTSKTAVPWESWSGGETQRLRIAGAVGLADLITARVGGAASLDLEVWDEPTQHLSGEGVASLLDFLARRARSLDRQIWLVDHRSLDYPFARNVMVVKTKAGSQLEDVA